MSMNSTKRPKKLSMIAAMAENRVIGVSNQLPWDMPADLAHFKQLTLGKPVLMGYNTFRSIGRPLPKRVNIVLSKEPLPDEGIVVVDSIDNAIRAAGPVDEAMVIGGASIYAQFLPLADRIYLTVIHAEPAGDAFFPELDGSQWRVVAREEHTKDDRNEFDYTFLTYDRVS